MASGIQDFILQGPMRDIEFFKILYVLYTATILSHQLNTHYIYIYIYIYILTPWSRVLLKKPTGSQLSKKFPHFMEPEGSIQQS